MNSLCVHCLSVCLSVCLKTYTRKAVFLSLFPVVSQTQLEAMTPILLLLSVSMLSLYILSFFFLFFYPPFSLLHAVLCSSLISTGWNWRKQRLVKPEPEKAVERSRGWWRDADGECLWEGWKGQQISGSHTEEKDDMSPAVVLPQSISISQCFIVFIGKIKLCLSFRLHCCWILKQTVLTAVGA